jgi:hypothetical protein
MIASENNTTTVTFGAYKKATIGVSVNGLSLYLQELASDKNIGDSICIEDIKDLPRVELEFNQMESIDVIIKALEVVRNNWIFKYQLALAC